MRLARATLPHRGVSVTDGTRGRSIMARTRRRIGSLPTPRSRRTQSGTGSMVLGDQTFCRPTAQGSASPTLGRSGWRRSARSGDYRSNVALLSRLPILHRRRKMRRFSFGEAVMIRRFARWCRLSRRDPRMQRFIARCRTFRAGDTAEEVANFCSAFLDKRDRLHHCENLTRQVVISLRRR